MAGTVLEELVSKIRFIADGRGLKQTRDELGRLKGKVKDTSNVLGAMRRSMVEAFAARTALNGLAGLARYIVHTNVEFQRLGASLKTVTGSSEAAGVAFAAIKKFARETPFSVQEVTTAFVRLKALGLDAGEDSLRSYGNTASALGKNVLDFVEAVADASTFEFERLKEFGIKASQQGDKVSFTFQGQTTTIAKSADAVQRYLKGIGLNQFAGAMDEQMKTLGGAFSNLNDAVEQFAVGIGEGGLAEALRVIALDLTGMVGSSGTLAQVLGQKLGKALTETWARLKKLGPQFSSLLDHLPDLVDLFTGIAKIMLSLVEGFAKFSNAVGGVDVAIKILLPGLAAMRVATIAAAGPWGALAAAMLAAIPIAMEAGDRIGSAVAGALHDLDRLDRLNGGRSGKRGQKLYGLKRREMTPQEIVDDPLAAQFGMKVSPAGWEVLESNVRGLDQYDLEQLAAGKAEGETVSEDVKALAASEIERRKGEEKVRQRAIDELGDVNAENIGVMDEANKRAARLTFDALMKKKRRGKLTPSEKKMLSTLSKNLNLSTDKGHKGKKKKEPKDSAGLAEIKDRVDELVKAEELRAFHRSGGTTEDREHAAKTAGEYRRSQLMAEVDRGNLSVLGGQFSRERMMMRDAGLLDEAMRAAPPVLTVNIQRYDVKVDAPVTVQVASANASAADIAAAARTAMRDVFRGEVRTAIETVRPVQKV
jgi:tape measure protein